jgi:acetyl esterase/lipase
MSNSILESPSGEERDGYYTNPADAPAEWWDGLARNVASRVFISAGQHECFRDDIIRFAETWKSLAAMDVTLVQENKGIHDSPLMDLGAGRPKTHLIEAIESWLAAALAA